MRMIEISVMRMFVLFVYSIQHFFDSCNQLAVVAVDVVFWRVVHLYVGEKFLIFHKLVVFVPLAYLWNAEDQ